MRRTAVVLAAVVALSGCGTETSGTSAQEATATSSTSATPTPSEAPDAQPSEEPSEEPSKRPSKKPSKKAATPPADAPECAAVWVDGTTLARGYEGCRAGQRFIAPDEEPCSFGQRLVRFSDRFYAVRGGPVNRTAAPLDEDRVYRGALASCRA